MLSFQRTGIVYLICCPARAIMRFQSAVLRGKPSVFRTTEDRAFLPLSSAALHKIFPQNHFFSRSRTSQSFWFAGSRNSYRPRLPRGATCRSREHSATAITGARPIVAPPSSFTKVGISGPRETTGTQPSPRYCESTERRRPAPGGSRSCPRSPEHARVL
jgi:hypothetical protein